MLSMNEPVREEWIFSQCFGIADGVHVVHKVMAMNDKPTALLVTGDQVAVGILMEAKRYGLRVPEDLAIIGFDNHPMAQVFDLTTLDNQLLAMGSTAFRIMHDHIVHRDRVPESRELDIQLIERSTV